MLLSYAAPQDDPEPFFIDSVKWLNSQFQIVDFNSLRQLLESFFKVAVILEQAILQGTSSDSISEY
jgi:hypothetical protein